MHFRCLELIRVRENIVELGHGKKTWQIKLSDIAESVERVVTSPVRMNSERAMVRRRINEEEKNGRTSEEKDE